ncbi:MAG TPA: hypothetical protein VM389_03090 [Phycisphaerae bacterium]|nr:hypothetical protein [Phycisphaerae bacterium]
MTDAERAAKAEAERDRWKHAWEDLWKRCDDEAGRRSEDRVRSTQEWYAVRHERLAQWAREDLPDELRTQFFNIYANGTREPAEAPTYMQMLQQAKWRAERAEKELARVRAERGADDA